MKINKINGRVVCPFCGNILEVSYCASTYGSEWGIVRGISAFRSLVGGRESFYLDYEEESNEVGETDNYEYKFDCCGQDDYHSNLSDYDIISMMKGEWRISEDSPIYNRCDEFHFKPVETVEIIDSKSDKAFNNLFKDL